MLDLLDQKSVAQTIDLTNLSPVATHEDIEKLCRQAVHYGFWAVCVNPWLVQAAAAALAGTEVKVCSVVGFPLGANLMRVKALETEVSVSRGAQEIDMVINLGAMKERRYAEVQRDIAAVVQAAEGRLVKVILECCYLTEPEIERGCELAVYGGAKFVKTSTGQGLGGATPGDVALIRRCVGPEIGVKAAGGIRSLSDLQSMLAAGASRIGTSAGVAILQEWQQNQGTSR